MVRSLISVLIIAVTLPWGAYAGAVSAAARVATEGTYAAGAVDGASAQQATAQPKPAAQATVAKRCRTATMPLLLCGADHMVPDEPAAAAEGSAGVMRMPTADWRVGGRGTTPPREPPRFF